MPMPDVVPIEVWGRCVNPKCTNFGRTFRTRGTAEYGRVVADLECPRCRHDGIVNHDIACILCDGVGELPERTCKVCSGAGHGGLSGTDADWCEACDGCGAVRPTCPACEGDGMGHWQEPDRVDRLRELLLTRAARRGMNQQERKTPSPSDATKD